MCARANRSSDNCSSIRRIPRRNNHARSHQHVNEFIEQQLSSYTQRSRAFATAAAGDTSTSVPSSEMANTASGSLFLPQEDRDFVGSTRRQENREASRRRLLRVLDEVLDIVQDE